MKRMHFKAVCAGVLTAFLMNAGVAQTNAAPTVTLVNPKPGGGVLSITTGSVWKPQVQASDSNGQVTRVEMLRRTVVLASDSMAPYEFSVPIEFGPNPYSARATDNGGAQATSVAVTIRGISIPGTLAKLANEGANASVASSKVVKFGTGDYWVQKMLTGTFACSVATFGSDPMPGFSKWCAVDNAIPTATLSLPGGANYTAPANIVMNAAVQDSDGTIAKVEYYTGSRSDPSWTLLGRTTTVPHSFTWSNVAAGTHMLSVLAYDNTGAVTESNSITVTVAATAPTAATTLYYVHPDHLGTPRLIADQSKRTVWKWDNQEPFGLTGLQEDPDGDGKKFVYNLRFAGQYYDQETGLHHNRNRDYDPAAGRYIQADPIGLKGGISLYSYVSGNPLSFVDPLGLARCESNGPVYKTTKEAAEAAEEMGFTRVKETVKGQAVFKKGNTYITRDVDGHNGGAWKMADSVKNLGSKSTREGTYSADLTRIGD